MPGDRLSLSERDVIARGIAMEKGYREIARWLGRPASTVMREVNRNGGRGWYRCDHAQVRCRERARRPKRRKLGKSGLGLRVEQLLRLRYSPEQISAQLRKERPDDPSWRVCAETIYQSLYVQGRGALRVEVARALRSGRARRYPGNVKPGNGKRGKIIDMVPISERPAEVEDRAVPGHWEGDLIIGSDNSQVATLVERSTRFVMLIAVPDRKAETVRKALARRVQRLPQELARSLTWDQGREMAEHAKFTVDTGVQVYFCDPHSPWQRGSNENTNGLIRQYLPKGTDLSHVTQRQLGNIARELNQRPRKTLNWQTPSEKLNQVLLQ